MTPSAPPAPHAGAGLAEVLPLTAQQRAAIRRERIPVYGYVLGIPVFTAVGAVFPFLSHFVGDFTVGVIVMVISAAFFNVGWLCMFAWSRHTSQRDLGGGTFTRWSGPLRVETTTTGSNGKQRSYKLVLGTTTLSLQDKDGERLSALGLVSGGADYATHSHDLFEVRDAAGAVVYRDKQMEKALGATVAAAPSGATG